MIRNRAGIHHLPPILRSRYTSTLPYQMDKSRMIENLAHSGAIADSHWLSWL